MNEIIGWIGSFFFAVCAIPQAYQSYKEGHSKGIGRGLLSMWLIGELLTLTYVLVKQDYPLIINYVFNLASLAVIIWFKLKPRSIYV